MLTRNLALAVHFWRQLPAVCKNASAGLQVRRSRLGGGNGPVGRADLTLLDNKSGQKKEIKLEDYVAGVGG